jgi:hypothetical protein
MNEMDLTTKETQDEIYKYLIKKIKSKETQKTLAEMN